MMLIAKKATIVSLAFCMSIFASTSLYANDMLDKLKSDKEISIEKDSMENVSWVQCKNTNTDKTKNLFSLYFGVTESSSLTPIRIFIRYFGDDWIFVKTIWGRIDGERFTIDALDTERDWKRDNARGKVWEWVDTILETDEDKTVIRKIINSKETIIRFEGSQYRTDRKLTSSEMSCMKKIIEVYESIYNKKW